MKKYALPAVLLAAGFSLSTIGFQKQEIKAAEIEERKNKKRQERAEKEAEKRRKEEEKNKNQILKM